MVLWSNGKVEAVSFAEGEFEKLQTVLTGLGEICWLFNVDVYVVCIWQFKIIFIERLLRIGKVRIKECLDDFRLLDKYPWANSVWWTEPTCHSLVIPIALYELRSPLFGDYCFVNRNLEGGWLSVTIPTELGMLRQLTYL